MDVDTSALPAQLANGHLSGTIALFARERRRAPIVVWKPDPVILVRDELRFLAEHWNLLRAGRDFPDIGDIRPESMLPVLGFVMLIDVIDGGRAFRYRLYGSRIAAYSGKDWTGKTTADMIESMGTAAPVFYDALYRAVLLRPEPVFTSNTSIVELSTATWLRLVLPLAKGRAGIVRFLVGNVPVFSNRI